MDNKNISIESIIYIIKHLDQFTYNDLKSFGFSNIDIDQATDLFDSFKEKPTLIIKNNGCELKNFKLADIRVKKENEIR